MTHCLLLSIHCLLFTIVNNRIQGECTVTYDDPPSASAAIDWFNKKNFDKDHVLSISLAEVKIPEGGWRGRSGRGGGGGGFDRSGPKGSFIIVLDI